MPNCCHVCIEFLVPYGDKQMHRSGYLFEGIWPYCVHFQLHKQLMAVELAQDCLIQLAITNHKGCQFKFSKLEFTCKT